MSSRRVAGVVLLGVLALGVAWLVRERPIAPQSHEDTATEVLEIPRVSESTAPEELALAPPAPADASDRAAEPIVESEPGAAARLLVRVRAREDARPLEGVAVTIAPVSDSPDGGALVDHSTSDARGEAAFGVASGIALEAWIDGRGRAQSVDLRIDALAIGEQRVVEVELRTADDVRYFGRVLRWSDRTPIAGATVRAVGSSGGALPDEPAPVPSEFARVLTGDDGAFELDLPSWREPTLRVEADGFGLALVQADAEHATSNHAQEILLERSATLEATIVGRPHDDGAELVVSAKGYALLQPESALLNLFSIDDPKWSASFDDDGRARIALPARCQLEASLVASGETLRRHPHPLVLEPGETSSIEFRFGRGCRVHGRVVDSSGAALAGMEVRAMSTQSKQPFFPEMFFDGTPFAQCQSAADGSFVFEDVQPGRYGVSIASGDSSAGTLAPDACASIAQVIEIGDEDRERDVQLVVHCGLYVSGTVIDSDGQPVEGAAVFAASDGVGGAVTASSRVDGRFDLGPLPPGSIEVTLPFDRLIDPRDGVRCRAGDAGIVLRIAKNGTLRGRVVDADTGRGCSATVRYQDVSSTETSSFTMFENGTDGSFDSALVPVGTYHVSAVTSDGRIGVVREVRIDGADDPDVRIAVSRGGRVRASFRGGEGRAYVRIFSDGVLVDSESLPAKGAKDFVVPLGAIEVRWSHVVTPSFTRRAPVAQVDRVVVTADTALEVVFEAK